MGQARSKPDDAPDRAAVPGVGVLPLLAAVALFTACKPDGPTEPPGNPAAPTAETFSVTLEWNAPTRDARGGPLDDLGGYRIHYRSSSPANGPGGTVIEVADVTRTTVGGLPAGQWRFGVTAYDVAGNESALSNEVLVEVGP